MGCFFFFPSAGTPVSGVWRRGVEVFSHVEVVLSHEGVCFPMCRVRCFFWPPWTHVGSLQEFLWGFVPPNPVSSCLLSPPPPTPLETLEVVCSQRVTLGHHMTQGGAWEAARKSQPPSPAPTPAKHEYPPWHKSRRRLPQETGAGSLRGKEEALPPCAAWEPVFPRVQDAYLSGNMFLHVDVCFPMQTAPFSLALPCILRASGPPPPT